MSIDRLVLLFASSLAFFSSPSQLLCVRKNTGDGGSESVFMLEKPALDGLSRFDFGPFVPNVSSVILSTRALIEVYILL